MNTESRLVFLKGKQVVLRPLEDADAPLLQRWINDPDLRQFLLNAFPLQLKNEMEFIERARSFSRDVIVGIEHEDMLIGTMGLHGISWIHGTATTGALIGDASHRGKGLGTDAKIALLEYAFNTLGLRKISSRVIAGNNRSQRYSEKCGYKVEAILKKQFLKDGKYRDEVILAVFKSDFIKAKKALGY
jgi:RimJ/RimL family protein N-acetyltransferase